jgi:hypothetical protein
MSISVVVPQNIGELLGQDLFGFQLQEVFFLELRGIGRGSHFSARFTDSRETERDVFCVDSDVLDRVERLLPERASETGKMLVLFHKEKGIAYPLDHPHYSTPETRERAPAIQIMDELEFLRISEGGGRPFEWVSVPWGFLPPPAIPKDFR